MDNVEFNKKLQEHFDRNNSLGLGELLLFCNDQFRWFVEKEQQRVRLLNIIVDICGDYDTNAKDFVKKITYEEFKARKGVSEVMALGLRLYLLYQHGVDWRNPNRPMRGLDIKE